MKKTTELAIFISSCDKYSDLWIPFFHFFNKYWPDCSLPILLSTNSKDFSNEKVVTLKSEQNSDWSTETLANLKKVNYEYILYLQDDYVLLKHVDTEIIYSLFQKMIDNNCDYLRLFPSPGPDKDFIGDSKLGLISESALYRTSLQAAFWKKETFEKILKVGENPWEYEIKSPERSKQYLFLSVKLNKKNHIKKQTFPITYHYLTAVLKGRWVYDMKKILKQEGILLDEKVRKTDSFYKHHKRELYNHLPLVIKKIMFKLKL